MRLFPEKSRAFMGPSTRSESSYAYLDRSARPEMQRVRDLVEEWYSRYPAHEQEQLATRFRLPDPAAFASVTLELYLHELLLRLGYQVTIHPRISPGHDRRPDFLATDSSGLSFYLEATLASEDWAVDQGAARRVADVLDKIDEIEFPNFLLHIEIISEPKNPPSVKEIKSKLQKWLEGLNPEAVNSLWDTNDLSSFPKLRWEGRDGIIDFIPIPKPSLSRGKRGERAIGIQHFGAKYLATHEKIRKALKEKATRYGTMQKPYVIAVNANVIHLSKIDLMQALFGDETFIIPLHGTSEPIRMVRKPNGFWSGPQGPQSTRVSAVMVVEDLKPWTVATSKLYLYVNPYAKLPCSGKILRLPRMEPKDGQMVYRRGITPRNLFGLPPNWPGDRQISI